MRNPTFALPPAVLASVLFEFFLSSSSSSSCSNTLRSHKTGTYLAASLRPFFAALRAATGFFSLGVLKAYTCCSGFVFPVLSVQSKFFVRIYNFSQQYHHAPMTKAR